MLFTNINQHTLTERPLNHFCFTPVQALPIYFDGINRPRRAYLKKPQPGSFPMKIKQIILIVFVSAILPSVIAIVYVFSLPPSERWLLIMKAEAQSYADALLSGDTAVQGRYKDDFTDIVTVANPKARTVLFSSRDDGRQLSLLYAPGENSAWLTYEKTGAKRIQEKWYTLER